MGRDGPDKRCRIDEREYYGADESKICRNPAKNCPKPPSNGDLSLLLSLQFNDNKEDMFREIWVQEGGCHFMMASPDYAEVLVTKRRKRRPECVAPRATEAPAKVLSAVR